MKSFFRYWSPVVFVLSLIFYLSSLPPEQIPHFEFPYLDKIEHFSIYFILGFVVFRALTLKVRSHIAPQDYKRALIISAIVGAVWGASDEWHQSFVPGRDIEFWDFVADTLGGFSGAFVGIYYRKLLALASLTREDNNKTQ